MRFFSTIFGNEEMPMGNSFPAAFSLFIDCFTVIFSVTSMFRYHYIPFVSIKQGKIIEKEEGSP
jgi:hypothetical protein